MKAKDGWQRHIIDLVSTTFDPTVYAVQWARDPRCLQRGAGHRRKGAFTQMGGSVCRLWASKFARD